MISRIFKHEFKSMFRDSMYTFLFVYPIILAIISYFLIPYLEDHSTMLVKNLIVTTLLIMNGILYGAVTGFTLLDDQDDKVILSLRITPISVRWYVAIKLLFSYLLGMIGTIIFLFASGFYQDIDMIVFIMIVILAPMQAPMFALIINLFASNKVEGFVIMKSSAMLLIAPIATIFLTNWTELLLGFLPGYWTTKLIYGELPLTNTFLSSHWLYFSFGILTHVVITYLVFILFSKKQHI